MITISPEAPLIYSTDSKEPARVLQLGRELLYSISGQIEWPYADVSYNVAELKPKTEYLIVNSVAIFVNNSGKLPEYLKLLEQHGATRDPFVVCRVRKSKKEKYPYLLLGHTFCYKEFAEIKMEDIVYFDYKGNGEIHFGTGIDYSYPKLDKETIIGIKEYFLSKGAPLAGKGKVYTTRVTFNPFTWFKKYRQTVVLGKRGIFYSRNEKGTNKSSFIPYFDIYFIQRVRWRLFGRKLLIYGTQNVVTPHTFKNSHYKRILGEIFTLNPQLKEKKGKAFRSFTWNPFMKKSCVVFDDGVMIYDNPLTKGRLALEGKYIRGAKIFGRFYHLFKDIVIDIDNVNIRYDEHGDYSDLKEKDEEKIQKKSKIDDDDEWMNTTNRVIRMIHLWRGTAKELYETTISTRGSESGARIRYKDSDRYQEGLKEKDEQMREYSSKDSLKAFIKKLRQQTGCPAAIKRSDKKISISVSSDEAVKQDATPVVDKTVIATESAVPEAPDTSINEENNVYNELSDDEDEIRSSGLNKSQMLIISGVVIGAILIIFFGLKIFMSGHHSSAADVSVSQEEVVSDKIESSDTEPESIDDTSVNEADTQDSVDVQESIDDNPFSYLSSRVISDEEVMYLDKQQLRILRNALYAMHGHIFKSADLRTYFMSFSWYRPVGDASSKLTPIEKKNLAIIQRYE